MESAVYLWNSRLLFLRKAIESTEHAHHAIQICLGLEGSIPYRDPDGRLREDRAFAIDSECRHTILAPAARHAFLFIEPELKVAQQIRASRLSANPIGLLDFSQLEEASQVFHDCYDRPRTCAELGPVVERLLHTIAQSPLEVRAPDRRVQEVLAILAEAPTDRSPADLAAEVGLSESRLQHLFNDEVGVPMRRYLLWRRLLQSIQRLSDSETLTNAAHEAGFADSAHFSRTFRQMFGITPSDGLTASGNQDRIAISVCDPSIPDHG